MQQDYGLGSCVLVNTDRIPMHVVMVIYNFWPGFEGGAERQCRKLSVELVRQGMQCTVFTARKSRSWSREDNYYGVHVVRLPCALHEGLSHDKHVAPLASMFSSSFPRKFRYGSWISDMLVAMDMSVFLAALTVRLFRQPVDLLHVHVSTSIAGYCSWLGDRLGIPVVVKETSYPALLRLERFVPGNRWWEIWRRRAHFLAMNEDTAEDLCSKGVESSQVTVIPNGVDMPDLSSRAEDTKLVLYVGNLTQGLRDKGLDMLVNAWARINRTMPSLKLWIAGRGDPSRLKAWAEELGCDSSIEFLGHVDNVADLYRRAAMLILPSRREGMSNVLLEAQSWGLPVVATDIPGNRAVLKDGQTGFLTAVDDAPALADAVVHLIGDPELRAQMGAAARALMESKFQISGIAHRMRTLYVRVVTEHGS
jgi:glycosyltransferase involved in cell wall biosynthesis